MTKRHDLVHRVENHRMIDHSIIVQLTKVLDLGNSSLIEFEIILLKTKRDVLNYVVDYRRYKVLMIPVQSADQNSQKMNITVLDLPRL
jgi:hypothetical protein